MFSLRSSSFLLQRFFKMSRLLSTSPNIQHLSSSSVQNAARSVAYISLGTNFGGNLRLKTIESALESIQKNVGIIDGCSCLYESLPGYDVLYAQQQRPQQRQQEQQQEQQQNKEAHDLSLPLHLNAVVRVKTEEKSPFAVLEALQTIEREHGRDRSPNAVRLHRTLDLDLLFFQTQDNSEHIQLNSEKLTLPHPRILQRNFVLFPLCDIQPDLVHPVEGKSIKDALYKNLKRREDILNSCFSESSKKGKADVYTLDGNLAVPRRCFAPNDNQLWTIKGAAAEASISDTLRWIEEVLRRYGLEETASTGSPNGLPEFAARLINLRGFLLRDRNEPKIMGILNITPDSFSDGGKYYNNIQAAVDKGREMVWDGADIIDVGGEATNPFIQEEVSVHSEIERVAPVIEGLREKLSKDIVISVDTRRKAVADAAVAAGADLINDVSGGEEDPEMFRLVSAKKYPIVVMHSRGTPQTMDSLATYDDVVNEVAEYLTDKTNALIKMGLPRWRIIVDIGLGFAKTSKQNFDLLYRISELRRKLPSGLPMLVGHSRKRFIGRAISEGLTREGPWGREEEAGRIKVEKESEMHQRDIAGLGVVCWSMRNPDACVDIYRVHDVQNTRLILMVMKNFFARQSEEKANAFISDLDVVFSPPRNK